MVYYVVSGDAGGWVTGRKRQVGLAENGKK